MSDTAWWIVFGISAGLALGFAPVLGLQLDARLRRRERRADRKIEWEVWERGRPMRELKSLHDELDHYLRICAVLDVTPEQSPFADRVADTRIRIMAKQHEVESLMERVAE